MLGLWQDEQYLRRKELRTVRDDKRDIIPDCVIRVRTCIMLTQYTLIYAHLLQEVRARYPSVDGAYKDYRSTFEAENI